MADTVPGKADKGIRPLRFGVVILAAGASTRMGSPKQLLPVGGRPLVVRAAEAALASSAWPVVVVLGARRKQIGPTLARLPVLVVDNPAWAEGMASSIRAGIATLGQFSRDIEGGLLALCDQPGLSAAAIERLAAALRPGGSSIAVARYDGHCGAPALFLREHFPALSALTGEEGARALIDAHPGQVTPVDLPELAADLDRPEDYAAWNGRSG